VHSTPRKFRGKVARVLASKISLAAKMDAFRGEDLSEGLKRELKVKVDKITQGDRK
jgi:RNA processing factor Prp31